MTPITEASPALSRATREPAGAERISQLLRLEGEGRRSAMRWQGRGSPNALCQAGAPHGSRHHLHRELRTSDRRQIATAQGEVGVSEQRRCRGSHSQENQARVWRPGGCISYPTCGDRKSGLILVVCTSRSVPLRQRASSSGSSKVVGSWRSAGHRPGQRRARRLAGRLPTNNLGAMDVASVPQRIGLVVHDLAERVRRQFGPRVLELRLYGSFARGGAGPDSDVEKLRLLDGRHARKELLGVL